MAETAHLRIRISDEMRAALKERADAKKKTVSEMAREILAKALQNKDLATVKPHGRPKVSENL